jgi:ADP-ribosylglycohydrolase
VEFLDLPAIRRKFGPGGIRDLAPAYGRLGAVTDDTQMTLFTAEGVLRAHVRGVRRGPDVLPAIVGHAYQRWLATQGVEGRAYGIGKDGWLLGHRALFSSRAPGTTCLSALAARAGIADAAPAANHSKGCGGVTRVAPIGLYAASRGLAPEQAFAWGCEVAALTHGHPTGQLPAGTLAQIICETVQGRPLPAALESAIHRLRRQPFHEETLEALRAAETLAAGASPADEALPRLGQGWVAEEALAIALFCALRAENLEEGLVLAANITGDSDSTAAITGNMLGAMLGIDAIPARWLEPLELREVITEMADDLATVADWRLGEPGPGAPERESGQAYWSSRYPGW